MSIMDGAEIAKMRYILYGHDPDGFAYFLAWYRAHFVHETGCSIVDIIKARIVHAHKDGGHWYDDPMHPHNIY